MKKYILIAVSIVLIIASVFCMPESMNPEILAGPGNGTNYRIKDFDDFSEVLDYFIYGSSSSANAGNGVESMAEIIRSTGHSSGTITEESYASITQSNRIVDDYDYYNNEYIYTTIGTSYSTFNRTLTIYMDGNNSYYVSKGMLKSNYTAYGNYESNESSSMKMIWDFSMLIYGKKMYMKFDSFIYEYDGISKADLSDIIGKWVEIPAESTYSMIAFVDSINRENLASIQRIINYGLEDMNRSGDVYSFNHSMYGENDTKVTIDLSNEENSSVKMVVDANEDYVTVDMRDIISFSNIDNTVIENNISDAEKLSEEELEEIFGGIE